MKDQNGTELTIELIIYRCEVDLETARAMLAAPEPLKACKAAMQYMIGAGYTIENDGEAESGEAHRVSKIEDACQAAIAKAEGK